MTTFICGRNFTGICLSQVERLIFLKPSAFIVAPSQSKFKEKENVHLMLSRNFRSSNAVFIHSRLSDNTAQMGQCALMLIAMSEDKMKRALLSASWDSINMNLVA